MKKHTLRTLRLSLAPLFLSLLPASAGLVVNPSFEFNYNPAWPHYATGEFPVDTWSGASGINLNEGPFHNTGTAVPDQSYVGFKQGSGDVTQFLSGLDPTKRYWVQYFYDARAGSLFDLSVTWDGEPIDTVAAVQPSVNQLYRFRNAVLQPTSDSGSLGFRTAVTGDSTLLLDAVCLVQRDEGEVVLQNPGFEASGDVADPGLLAQIAGWTVTGNVGVNSSAGPFANNGTIPEQDHALFIQQAGMISQTVKGLIPGQNYAISFRCNARTGNTPHLLFAINSNGNSTVLYDQNVTPVGGAAAYRTVNASFLADSDTAELVFEQTVADGDQTVLLDDIHMKGQALAPLPDLIVGPASIELAPETTGMVSVTVSGERLERGACVVRLRSSNTGVADFENVDAGGGIDLTFDAGMPTTTLTAEIKGFVRGVSNIVVEDNGGHDGVQGTIRIDVVNSFVRNASFEGSGPPPGVGYGAFVGWSQSNLGGSGLNTAGMPFASGTVIPDRGQAAFFQGANLLTQTIYGLNPGTTYQLQFHYNARNCCGGIPSLIAMIDGVEIANIPEIQPVAGPFYFHQASFVPAAGAESVELSFKFDVTGGDGSALLDAVNIVERPSSDVLVINPSFEASGIAPGVGYLNGSAIAGWTMLGGYGVNVDERGPFTDNGIAAAQDRVLFMQNNASAAQQITGLTAGEDYTLTFLMNARNGDASGGTPFEIYIDGLLVEEGFQDPVGAGQPYTQKSYTFKAASELADIQIKCVPPGVEDQTLLIDDVRVTAASAAAAVQLTATSLAGNSVVLKWPASSDPTLVLMSSTSMTAGSWTNVSTPPDVIGGFNTVVEPYSGTRKFYALFKP